MAAQSFHRSKSALGDWFRRIRAKLGTKAAVTAAGHKLARILYAMVKHRTLFEPGRLIAPPGCKMARLPWSGGLFPQRSSLCPVSSENLLGLLFNVHLVMKQTKNFNPSWFLDPVEHKMAMRFHDQAIHHGLLPAVPQMINPHVQKLSRTQKFGFLGNRFESGEQKMVIASR